MEPSEEIKKQLEEKRHSKEFDAAAEKIKVEIATALNVSRWFDNDLFLMDFWNADSALDYLVGIYGIEDYGFDIGYPPGMECADILEWVSNWTVKTLGFEEYSEAEGQQHIVEAFRKKAIRLNRIWESGKHEKSNPPIYYIDWALSKGIEIPWLEYAIENGFYKPKLEKIITKEKVESTRKTENLLRALTCIAIDAYGHSPEASKSNAPTDISEAMNKLGFTVDPKTVRGWLKEGADLLPSKPQKD